jgi:tetratricopeptide (TPR) repeat protein
MPRILFVFAVLIGMWASPARADDREKALILFENSDKAYKAGKFEEAVALLREAYQLYPEPLLLYNLGRAQEGLGDTAGALESYEQYLKDAKEIKDRGAIERRIETLKAQIAKAEADARQRAEEEERRRREEEERKRNPPPPIDTRTPLEKYGPWTTMGVGGAVVLTGVYFGVRASSRHDDALATPIQRDAAELQASAERSATIANVMFAAGGAVLAGGIVWKLLQWKSGSDNDAQSTQPQGAQLKVGPGSIALEWVLP